jgi:hypothetical protein
VSSVLLFLLLLCVAGKPNRRSRNHYIQGQKSFLLRWPPTIALHFQVGAAIALVVVGYTSKSKSGPTLAKVGYILFVLFFVFIAAFTSLSWKYCHTNIDSKRVSKCNCNNKAWFSDCATPIALDSRYRRPSIPCYSSSLLLHFGF